VSGGRGCGTRFGWSRWRWSSCDLRQPAARLLRIVASSQSDSEEFNFATANCPVGTNVLGTGGEITGGGGAVVLEDVRPNGALTSVTVTGFENETGTTANRNVAATRSAPPRDRGDRAPQPQPRIALGAGRS
jgi:hypothetical protein